VCGADRNERTIEADLGSDNGSVNEAVCNCERLNNGRYRRHDGECDEERNAWTHETREWLSKRWIHSARFTGGA